MSLIRTTSNNQIRTAYAGNLFICVLLGERASDETWDEFCHIIGESNAESGSVFPVVFNYSPTFVPTSRQRHRITRELAEVTQIDRVRRTALLTESTLVRGALTAVTWLVRGNNKLKVFHPRQSGEAFAFLAQEAAFDVAEASALLALLCADAPSAGVANDVSQPGPT